MLLGMRVAEIDDKVARIIDSKLFLVISNIKSFLVAPK